MNFFGMKRTVPGGIRIDGDRPLNPRVTETSWRRVMNGSQARKRDVFEWVGVFVDVVQALLFVGGGLGLLYWYTSKGGGLPAVMVGLTAAVLVLLVCVVTLLARRR
jgi:hypothetical protein